jgi:hypothetical protein
MKHRPCPFCNSTDLGFTSNVSYGHGDCGYNGWIECQNCGAQHGHVFDYGYPDEESEHKAWCIWDGVKREYIPKETPLDELSEQERLMRQIAEKYGRTMSLFEFLLAVTPKS